MRKKYQQWLAASTDLNPKTITNYGSVLFAGALTQVAAVDLNHVSPEGFKSLLPWLSRQQSFIAFNAKRKNQASCALKYFGQFLHSQSR